MTVAERPRICVVNDNPDFLEVMSAILADDAGYEVSLHDGAHATLEDLQAHNPDLIIIDLLLGGASGWEIAALARADAELSSVPIIICSADITQLKEKEPELERVGNMYLLRKPFGIDDVTELVERLVGRGQPAEAGAGGQPIARP